MILHLKNKNQLAFVRMIQNVAEDGGIPDYIEINQYEAYDLLKELHKCKDLEQTKHDIKITFDDAEQFKFLLYGSNPIDKNNAKQLIARWAQEQISVKFQGVPIRVVIKNMKKVDNHWNNEDS